MTGHETTQQAIEDYLEALLSDEEQDYTATGAQDIFSEPLAASNSHEESWQERQLRASMQQQSALEPEVALEPASIIPAFSTVLDEPLSATQVILPDLNLPPKPKSGTLAEVVQELEAAAAKDKATATIEATVISEAVAAPEVEAVVEEVESAVVEELSVDAVEHADSAISEPVTTAPELQVTEVVTELGSEVQENLRTRATEQLKPVDTEATSLAAGQPPSPPTWQNGRPVWGQERFECLLFKVKGLTLAVPLVELGGIVKVEKEPTPLFGQPSWFLGMLRNNNMNISMVDTAQWVLPPALISKNNDPYELVIRLHNSNWGLACNQVDRSISLEPEQVRWRTSLGTRPWLAGTVIEQMCALIDPAAFARLLQEGHGNMQPANLSQLKNIDFE